LKVHARGGGIGSGDEGRDMTMLDEAAALRMISEALEEMGKPTGPLTMETSILHDLSLDSVAAIDFIMVIETRLDTIIPMDSMAAIETVGDLVRVLTRAPAAAA
jgi:acyl carrier protein